MEVLFEVVENSGGIWKLQVALRKLLIFTAFKLSEDITSLFTFIAHSFNYSFEIAFQIGGAYVRNTDLLTHKFVVFELFMWILCVCPFKNANKLILLV